MAEHLKVCHCCLKIHLHGCEMDNFLFGIQSGKLLSLGTFNKNEVFSHSPPKMSARTDCYGSLWHCHNDLTGL